VKEHEHTERCWCRPAIWVIRDNADDIIGIVTAHNVDETVPVPVQLDSAQANEQDTREHYWTCRCRRCYPEAA